LHISMEMDIEYENNLITQISLPLFIMHQKGKRHQHERDINLKKYMYKGNNFKTYESIIQIFNSPQMNENLLQSSGLVKMSAN